MTVDKLSAEERELLARRSLAPPPSSRAASSRGVQRTPRPEGTGPTSFQQEQLWFLSRLDPDAAAYNEPMLLRIRGPLDKPALTETVAEIGRRHEILRTTLHESDGVLVQRINQDMQLHVQELRARGATLAEREASARALFDEEMARPFDLSEGPLLRAKLVAVDDDDHFFFVVMHHAVTDAWSFDIYARELAALYTAFATGSPSPLQEPPIQYADYATWQRIRFQDGALERQLSFWKKKLAGVPDVVDLPLDRPRSAAPLSRAATVRGQLTDEIQACMRELGRELGVTAYMICLATFGLLVGRWAGQNQVIVSSPSANRPRPELANVLGCFVNSLAIPIDLRGNPTFRELLLRVKDTCLDAYTHQDTPFQNVVMALNPKREIGRNPLAQVSFNLLNQSQSGLELPGLDVTPLGVKGADSKFDVTLRMNDGDGKLELIYRRDLFEAATMESFVRQYVALLGDMVSSPDRRVASHSLLVPEERRLLFDWSIGARPKATPTVLASFEAAARRHGDTVAVVFSGAKLTYAELDARANALAHALFASGAKTGDTVGLTTTPCLELLIGVLGIWKAGCAYVPLDPALPAERLRSLTSHLNAVVLPDGVTLDVSCKVVRVGKELAAEPPQIEDRRSDPAYVLFTSGSTGVPKGVIATHANLASYVHGVIERLELPTGSYSLASTFAADLGLTVLFPPLVLAGTLHVLDEDTRRTPSLFQRYMEENAIDVLKIVPSHFLALTEGRRGFPRKRLVFGGESTKVPDAREIRAHCPPECRIFNHYGPTETTVGVLTFELPKELTQSVVPLGRPLPGCSVYILDSNGQPNPIGVYGEVCVGGAQVTLGYLADAAKTAERYVPDPFSTTPGARMYRTGDRGRWLRSGVIEFAGRLDHQVKVRGFRIELGDVAASLRSCTGVRDAVVFPYAQANETSLVAYVVGAGLDPAAIRSELKTKLPDYMLPSAIVPLDALPLTANGKVDRRALPPPDFSSATLEYVAPRTPTEKQIGEVFAQVLGVGRVGIHDDFFALGGHSLLAMRAVARLSRQLGHEVPVRALIEAPTIEALATKLANSERIVRPPLVRGSDDDERRISYVQQVLAAWESRRAPSPTWVARLRLDLRGPLDVGVLREAVTATLMRHETLRWAYAEGTGLRVLDASKIPLEIQDQSNATDTDVDDLCARHASRPFTFDGEPLVRFLLFRRADDLHVLMAMWHFFVHDARPGALAGEILDHYALLREGKPPKPALPFSYPDYVRWERAWYEGPGRDEVAAARRAISSARPLDLGDLPRRDGTFSTDAVTTPLAADAEAFERIERIARSMKVSMVTVLNAAVTVFLSRWSGRDDVVFMSPVELHSMRIEFDGMLGRFGNTVPMQISARGNPMFGELVERARDAMLETHTFQQTPTALVLDTPHTFDHPLCNVIFNVPATKQSESPRRSVAGLTVIERPVPSAAGARNDLLVVLMSSRTKIGGYLRGAAHRFHAETIKSKAAELGTLLRTVETTTRVHDR